MAEIRKLEDTVSFDFINPTVDLFDTTAHEFAYKCSCSILNKSTQVRRFYDELVLWTDRSKGENFKKNLPFIYMIRSKVAYAFGRKLVDTEFQKMMFGIINGIKENNPETLTNAKLFLEAFMGYFKSYRGDK